MNETAPTSEKPVGLLTPLIDYLVALQFLTLMPPVIQRIFTPKEMGRATGYYPLVGLTLGVVLYGGNLLLSRFFSPLLSAALVLVLWVLLTGALHIDGFLDATDGLLGGFTPDSRMEIMRDEHKGAFAVAGGILLLLVKFAALVSVLPVAPLALLLVPTLGRWGMTLAVVFFPYARTKGLGKDMKDNSTWKQALLASLVALGVGWFTFGLWGLAAALLALVVFFLCARFTLARIPGLTGDIYGLINEWVELIVLLAFAVKI
jgi:adenosylcobinamide-GDP ribazoletransferase